MNFAQTEKLVKAIGYLETWTRSIERENRKEEKDYTEIAQLEKWLEEAKQEIFDLASR
jgi:hypothetical protein